MRLGHRFQLVPVAAVLLLATCSSPTLSHWFRATGPLATATGGARMAASGITIDVQEVGGSARAGLLRQLTGATFDPFDVSREGELVFRTFALDIVNGSSATVEFNPSFSIMAFGESRRYPLGYAELYSFLSTAVKDDSAISKLAPLLKETSSSIPPGGQVTRLLVFNRIPEEAASAHLELAGLRSQDQDIAMRVEFTRIEEKP